MNNLRVFYHMARADYLERTRRYSFLIMLGLVVWIGYLSASGQFRMRVPPDYIGVINSAWVGGTMTITVTLLLGWIGFYLVKGSVARDYDTGVGQIMATTPLSRPLYTLGKWFSNFIVLGIMVLILLLVGILMNVFSGSEDFNLWALAAPLLIIALPCMAIVAAAAVLFESIHWLRGGLGNIIYFILFMTVLIVSTEGILASTAERTYNPFVDFTGLQLIGGGVTRAAQAAYPEITGGFAFSITPLENPKLFQWDGIDWTAEVLLPRFVFLLTAIGISLLAAIFFDRFNPSRLRSGKRKPIESPDSALMVASEAAPISNSDVHLTPLVGTRRQFRFDALFVVELKLFLKGQRWWWYVIAFGLITAQLFSELEATRILLIVSWTWPILILSGLGCRENRYDTRQIIFSAPRPLMSQIPAAWLSAFTVLALMGSGALVRFIFAGETTSLLGWITGVLFIPSLALCFGVMTGSSKAFEVIYVLWMYLLTQRVPQFDFINLTGESPLVVYILLAGILLAAAIIARQRQLTSRRGAI